jgi:hypothetical protein
LSPANRVPIWRAVAHAVLVLSLVFNVGINISLNQPKEGTHMENTIKKSALSGKRNAGSTKRAEKTTGTNCMGVRSRRPG